jgi:transposase-like protein
MTPAAIIRRCITQVARHKDGRGPWQSEHACAKALGGSIIDRNTAAAARRLGEWLRTVGKP